MSDQPEDRNALKPPFGADSVEVTAQEEAYRGFFSLLKVRLRHKLFGGGWSAPFERELFVRGDAVGVLLFDPEHELVALTEQFRIGALGQSVLGDRFAPREGSPWCLEVVAGMAEEGESLEDVARREVREEAGQEVAALYPVSSYFPSPGGTCERMHLYCATLDLRNAEGYFGLAHEHEDIRLRVFPLQDLVAALDRGRDGPDNAATIICLQWLQLNRHRIQPHAG